MNAKHVYKVELAVLPENGAKAIEMTLDCLKLAGKQAALAKPGAVPVLTVDGVNYQLTVASAAASGIGAPCAVLREL